MYLKLNDAGISRELTLSGVHEPIATRLLNQQIKSGMRVIEIGANIGYYALQEARLVGEGGEIIAIEPAPDNIVLLRKNIEANGIHNIRIYEGAIGNKNGTIELYLPPESNWSSIIPDKYAEHPCINVTIWKLDSLLADIEQVDVIRMDIEGYEIEAIKGMLGILQKYKPRLIIEIHPQITGGEPIKQFLERLMQLGYETKYVISRTIDHKFFKERKKYVETQSLNKLISDKRVVQGLDGFMIFLEAN